MITVSLIALSLAAVLFMYRLLIGPTLADRVNALNGMLIAGTCAIAAHAADTGRGAFLPILVVITLVGFVGTAMVARFIESRGR
ncbi:MAG: monovalent cation/H+ antiporter complex subunit F [Actinomycetota bacterium]|nr:monovalent cation/H+ antiporter complex subunit F [Actinomycetota bacterium]